jgi:hypothetical protein
MRYQGQSRLLVLLLIQFFDTPKLSFISIGGRKRKAPESRLASKVILLREEKIPILEMREFGASQRR